MMRHRSLEGWPRSGPACRLLGLAVLALLGGRPAGAAEPAAPDKAFVGDHCTSCHNAESKKGRLDLTGLAFDPKRSGQPGRLGQGARPREGRRDAAQEPGPARRGPAEGLRRGPGAVDRRRGAGGPGRRGPGDPAPAQPPRVRKRPARPARRPVGAGRQTGCPRTARPTASTRAARRSTCPTCTMERFMDSADYAMRLAMATGLERPAKTTRKLYARDEPSLRNWWPRENGTLPDRLSFPVLDSHAQPDVRAGRAPGDQPGDARARGGRQGVEHLQRRGRLQLERLAGAGRGPLQAADRRVHDLGRAAAAWPAGSTRARGPRRRRSTTRCLWHRPNLDEV